MKSSQAAVTRRPGVPAPGDVIAGKYRVEGVVGAGGMGVVISARHTQLGQTVAIKLLTPPLEEERKDEAIARFLHEAQAAAKLQSDHVVRIHDVGQLDNGMPFMVMELLSGMDLGSLLDQQGPMPEATAVDFVLQACAGVAEAHRRGIVHRDLKPSNLFVTERSDGLPLLKVLDFGISKQLTDPLSDELAPVLTNTRTLMGSPHYMSPEQIRDARSVDARTDVWSLGIILQELLTDAPVFRGESFPGVCAAIVADPPMPVRTMRPDVSKPLEAVLERCLQKDPAKRFPGIAELVAALSEVAPRVSVAGSEPRPLVYGSHTRLNLGASERIAGSGREARGANSVNDDGATLSISGSGPTLESARLLTKAGTLTAISSPASLIEVLGEPPTRFGLRRKLWLAMGLGALALGALFWLTQRPATRPAVPSASAPPTHSPGPELRTPAAGSAPPGTTSAAATPSALTSAANASPPSTQTKPRAAPSKRPPPSKPAGPQPPADIRLER